jgi:hypothetical protein
MDSSPALRPRALGGTEHDEQREWFDNVMKSVSLSCRYEEH